MWLWPIFKGLLSLNVPCNGTLVGHWNVRARSSRIWPALVAYHAILPSCFSSQRHQETWHFGIPKWQQETAAYVFESLNIFLLSGNATASCSDQVSLGWCDGDAERNVLAAGAVVVGPGLFSTNGIYLSKSTLPRSENTPLQVKVLKLKSSLSKSM